jgi:heterodisulfide reductase subunit C
MQPSKIHPDLRHLIQKATRADSTMCWTCSSCDAECPVEIATSRLRPQRIVRLATLGLIDELIVSPEIWYCLTCRRCTHICPNLVKPETLVRYARAAAVRCGVVPYKTARACSDLFRRFQRVRWHAVDNCLRGESKPVTDAQWRTWLNAPIPHSGMHISSQGLFQGSPSFRQAAKGAGMSACFTCGECSSACPVAGERSAFDPRFIFRMVNFGLTEELLRSPSIWLCVQCGRCTEACSQLVDGCRMIVSLREFAVHEGVVDADFALRVRDAQKQIYVRWVDAIDKLLGLQAGQGGLAACRLPVAECV